MATLDDGTLTVADWLEAAAYWCGPNILALRRRFDDSLRDLEQNLSNRPDRTDWIDEDLADAVRAAGLLALAGVE